MESREHDLRAKIDVLRRLLDGGGSDPEALFRAAESAALALEFRATDAMIGLDAVPRELVKEAEQAVQRAQTLAAEAGFPEACVQLAESIWLARDTARAERALELVRSVPNDAQSRYLRGLFAFNGFGCQVDLKESFEQHLEAAQRGHSGAMFELYAMSAQGLGCVADQDAALEWCKRSAEAGNARAMANLGGFFATGRGVQADAQKSVYWYDRAARAGHGKAAATLGIMYALGSGPTPSVESAQRYFAMADELGYDWRTLAEAAGVDLADLLRVTLRPPPPSAPKTQRSGAPDGKPAPKSKAVPPKAAAKPKTKAAPKAKPAPKPKAKPAPKPKAKPAPKPKAKAKAAPKPKAKAKAAPKPKAKAAAKAAPQPKPKAKATVKTKSRTNAAKTSKSKRHS